MKILIYSLNLTYGENIGASLIFFPTLGRNSFGNQLEIISVFFRFLYYLKCSMRIECKGWRRSLLISPPVQGHEQLPVSFHTTSSGKLFYIILIIFFKIVVDCMSRLYFSYSTIDNKNIYIHLDVLENVRNFSFFMIRNPKA